MGDTSTGDNFSPYKRGPTFASHKPSGRRYKIALHRAWEGRSWLVYFIVTFHNLRKCKKGVTKALLRQ